MQTFRTFLEPQRSILYHRARAWPHGIAAEFPHLLRSGNFFLLIQSCGHCRLFEQQSLEELELSRGNSRKAEAACAVDAARRYRNHFHLSRISKAVHTHP